MKRPVGELATPGMRCLCQVTEGDNIGDSDESVD